MSAGNVCPYCASTILTTEPDSSTHHSPTSVQYASLQTVFACQHPGCISMTDSGSICIKDVNAARRLLNKLGYKNCQDAFPVINLDNIKIGLEWNSIQKQLIFKHLEGDTLHYESLCHQLISTII